jgi:hypothetical protein
MNTNWTRGLSLVGLLLASAATTQANDIVDFLNAINGNSGRRTAPVAVQPVHDHDNEHGHGGVRTASENYGARGYETPYGGYGVRRSQVNTVNLRAHQHAAPPARSRTQIRLQFASNGRNNAGYAPPVYNPVPQPLHVLPPVQSYPVGPAYPQIAPSPFELGQFVQCQVPLETCVRVEDECNIAPNAVPVVIAVRDPHMCVHETQERLVYVQICVPPCPLRDLRVSPCRTRISLDYGRYEVDIKSANGMIVIDYDN